MRAVVLVGHGSLRGESGKAMMRLAKLAEAQGLAPIVEAGFLNFSRPGLAETLDRCLARGAREVVVQPYFLISGHYVQRALPGLVSELGARHPHLRVAVAGAFEHHTALRTLVERRARAAGCAGGALLLMAHGTPHPGANAPLYRIRTELEATGSFRDVTLAFLELNPPTIPAAIEALAAQGNERITAVPYFLHLGEHVAEDLPNAVCAAAKRHPGLDLRLAEHLGFDPALARVVRTRVQETNAPSPSLG